MKRFTKGVLVALATISIGVAGCQNQGTDESLDVVDPGESMDMTVPSDDMTDASDGLESEEAFESEEASPSDDA